MTLLSEIYDVTLKRGNRGACREGYYRPTLSEFFMTDHDYVRRTSRFSNNLCIGGTATASSNTTGIYSLYYAFPIIRTSKDWRSNAADVAWVQYEFSEAVAIERVAIIASNNYSEKAPTAFTITGSNIGTFTGEEVLLAAVTVEEDWVAGERREFDFVNRENFLYYRITMTDKRESFGKTYEYILAGFEMFSKYNVTAYSDNLCLSAESYSASYNIEGVYGMSNLFDDYDDTSWYSGPDDVAWLQFNFNSPEKIEQIVLGAYLGDLNKCPITFTLKGSNTGEFNGEETTVLNVVDADYYDEYLMGQIFNFTNNNAYSSYRITMTNKEESFGKSHEFVISTLKLYKIMED